MKKQLLGRTAVFAAAVAALMFVAPGCSRRADRPDTEAPTVITLWHAYNAFAKAEFDRCVDRFNDTVGKEKGIIVDTYGFGSSAELDEALYDSANQIIGAEPLPDLFTAYPDSARRLDEIAPLMNLEDYFDGEELDKYRPEFLAEGMWEEGGSPRMLPIAKSTELLFLNSTEYDRFSRETGADPAKLGTWEGLKETAEGYWKWSGGKPFLGMNGYNDFAILSAVQLGCEPFRSEGGTVVFNYPRDVARQVWELYYVPHLMGWYRSETYNQDGVKSGKLAAYIGSSAGAGYFPEEVIVNEGKRYPIECRALSYPTFEGKKDYMTQRGANLCAFSSDPVHERASAEFMKWFTEPAQNVTFAASTGYLPVEKEALSSLPELLAHPKQDDNGVAVEKSVAAALGAMENREFYVKRCFKGAYEADRVFGESLGDKVSEDLEALEVRVHAGGDREALVAGYVGEENFESWYQGLLAQMDQILNGETDEE